MASCVAESEAPLHRVAFTGIGIERVQLQLCSTEHRELSVDQLPPREVDEALVAAAVHVRTAEPAVACVDIELEDRLLVVTANEIDDLLAALHPDMHAGVDARLGRCCRARVPRKVRPDQPNVHRHVPTLKPELRVNSFASSRSGKKTWDMTFVVRPAQPHDGMAMGRIHVAAWRSAYVGVMPDSYLDGLDAVTFGQRWESTLREGSGGSTVLVVLRHDKVAAMCSVGPFRASAEPDDPTGELWMLNCDPSAFGSGAAVALHTEALRTLAEQGHRSAALWVVDRNPRARRFYEREGWSADGVERVDEVGGTPIHELRYVRNLSEPGV
jgi:GNAT superfamily N-acetyltransferase